jgi:hypothetical protein
VYKEDYICKSASAEICLDDDEEEDGTEQSEDKDKDVKQSDNNNKTSYNEGQKGEEINIDSLVHLSDGDKKPRAIGRKKEGSRVSKVNFYWKDVQNCMQYISHKLL